MKYRVFVVPFAITFFYHGLVCSEWNTVRTTLAMLHAQPNYPCGNLFVCVRCACTMYECMRTHFGSTSVCVCACVCVCVRVCVCVCVCARARARGSLGVLLANRFETLLTLMLCVCQATWHRLYGYSVPVVDFIQEVYM